MPYCLQSPVSTTSTYLLMANGRNSKDVLNFVLLYAAETDPD